MNERMTKLKKMLEAEPNDPFCLYALAQEHARQGELDEAVTLYEQALEVDPAHCYAYFHLARALEERGETDRARATLESGLERAQSSGDEKAAEEISAYLDTL